MDLEKLVIVDYLQSNYSKSTQAVKTKSHSSKGRSEKEEDCKVANSTLFLELFLSDHHGVESGDYKYEVVGVRALADRILKSSEGKKCLRLPLVGHSMQYSLEKVLVTLDIRIYVILDVLLTI